MATEQEQRLRRLLEAMPDGIAVYRGRRLTYVNAAFVTHLGYDDPGQLVGRALSELIGSGERDAMDDTISQRIRNSIPSDRPGRLVERVRRRDGSTITAEITALAMEHEQEAATLLIVRDITERLALQAQLVRADRLAALGKLAAGIAHEINNPLCYLVANLDLVADEVRASTGSGRVVELVREAMDGAGRVRRIVRDLRTLVHPGAEREEEEGSTDLRELLESTLNVAAHEVRHRAELVRDYEDVPAVRGESGRLGQVFLNLIVNAAQSIETGSAATNRIKIAVRRGAPGWVDVEIEDTGCGIPADRLEHVFDPFFTTKPVGAGTGLGLAICHGIVTALGGTITLENAPVRGTRVRVSLPEAPERQPVRPPPAPAEPPPVRLSVLVVDDEVMVGRALSRILGSEHDVAVAQCARQALEQLALRSFDVVLCDLMMPDMTGMDLYHEVQTRYPGLDERFIFITGGAFTARARDFLERVPNQRIEKPFDPNGLRALLRDRARQVAGRGGGAAAARPKPSRLWCASC